MNRKKEAFGYIVIVALLALTGIFSIRLFFLEKASRDKVDIAKVFPYTIAGWQGKDLGVTEEEYKILETRNLILREYTDVSGEKLGLFIIYSETNRSVFHPPEVCFIGSGLAIEDKQPEPIATDKYNFSASKLYAEKGNYRELVLYCYKAGNLYTDSYYLQQAYLALHQVFGKRIPGATIRVSIPMKKDEAASLAVLKKFFLESVRIIDSLQA